AVWPVVEEELAELREAVAGAGAGVGVGAGVGAGREGGAGAAVAAEVGDVLFSVVNLARKLDVDAEAALRGAAGRFAHRVAAVERLAAGAGRSQDDLADLTPAALDALWQRAKGE
ncbi:MAG: MazG nucleotide pyrophosphohydrolase domain-containing protein, partial [Acidiferrobacteraceae bacterium]